MSALSLNQYQEDLALYLRDPENKAMPQHLDERRAGVYRDLVFNNIESQLASAFPVIHSLYDSESWQVLVREFLRDFRAQTPYFTQLSKEFVSFLATRTEEETNTEKQPAFLLELAHYERVEIDLFMRNESYERKELDDHALVNEALGLVSTVQLLAYAYPVHRIAPDYQPQQAPESPTMLLLFQDEEGEVRFFELQTLAYELVSALAEGKPATGFALLRALAERFQLPFTPAFQQQGLQLLAQLNRLKVLRIQ